MRRSLCSILFIIALIIQFDCYTLPTASGLLIS
jgi:hypothetical protein